MNIPSKQQQQQQDHHPPPPPVEQTTLEPDEVENPEVGKMNDSLSNRDELNIKKTSDALAKGVSSILGTLIKEFDSKAQNTATSQDQLSSAIDRLTGELDQLLEDAPLPFIMQHASKISGVRKRVLSLNSVLKSIQRRIDNIDRLISTGVPHEKATGENSGRHQH